MTSPSWAALIARLRADDESALRELMDAEYQQILALAYRYVRTPDLASDIAQDVFCKLWERRHVLRDDIHLVAYIRRATQNFAVTLLRRDASAARLGRSLLREHEIGQSHADNLGVRATEAAEFDVWVRAVFDTLTPRVREVALLYYERGLEPAEIAALLNIAPTSVYGALRKVMQALGAAHRDF